MRDASTTDSGRVVTTNKQTGMSVRYEDKFHLNLFTYRTPCGASEHAMAGSRLCDRRVASGGYDEEQNKPRMRVTCGID
jgi:hypothetical protein